MSAKPLESTTLIGLYDEDFLAWCEETGRLLRARRFAQVDVENLIEEVEAMAGSQRRELESRLTVLLLHLLKWERQPGKRKLGWENTIVAQRRELRRLFQQSPSLRPALAKAIIAVYSDAVEDATRESRLPVSAFPPECPYTPEQIMDRNFLPAART